MSDKIDFMTYLKSTLTAASTKVLAANPTDTATAGRLDQIVRTAENISDGFWLRIAPDYQGPWPIAPALFRSVNQLNTNIIAGQNVANFDAYASPRKADYLDTRPKWLELLRSLVLRVASKLAAQGAIISPPSSYNLLVNGSENVAFRIARWSPGRDGMHFPYWVIQRRHLATGWIVAVRLGENNSSVLDYVLLPTSATDRNVIRFSELGRARGKLSVRCFASEGTLIRSLSRCVANSSRSSSAKLARPSKQARPNRPKTKSGHARR